MMADPNIPYDAFDRTCEPYDEHYFSDKPFEQIYVSPVIPDNTINDEWDDSGDTLDSDGAAVFMSTHPSRVRRQTPYGFDPEFILTGLVVCDDGACRPVCKSGWEEVVSTGAIYVTATGSAIGLVPVEMPPTSLHLYSAAMGGIPVLGQRTGDVFHCVDSGGCEWENYTYWCPASNSPPGEGALGYGVRELRPDTERYSGDANGSTDVWVAGTFRRIGAPVGVTGTPPGYNAPDGKSHRLMAGHKYEDENNIIYDYWDYSSNPCDDCVMCGYNYEGVITYDLLESYCTPTDYDQDTIEVELSLDNETRRMGFLNQEFCMARGPQHLCFGKPPGGGNFFNYPHNVMFDRCGFDTNNVGIVYDPVVHQDTSAKVFEIQALALRTINRLNDVFPPNMDQLDHYTPNNAYSPHLQDTYARWWPDPLQGPDWSDEHALQLLDANGAPIGEYILQGRLRDSGATMQLQPTIKAVSVWMSLQMIGYQAYDGGTIEDYPCIRFGIDMTLGLRALMPNYPYFDPPFIHVRNWLPEGTVNREIEVYALGTNPTELDDWTVPTERVLVLDDDGKPFTYPRLASWRGEYGPDNGTWLHYPHLSINYNYHEYSCARACQMLSLAIPAERRRTTDTALDVYDGEVVINMDYDGMVSASCDCSEYPGWS